MGSFLSFDFDRTLKKQKVTMEVTFSVSGRAAAWSSRKAALCGGAGLPPGVDRLGIGAAWAARHAAGAAVAASGLDLVQAQYFVHVVQGWLAASNPLGGADSATGKGGT